MSIMELSTVGKSNFITSLSVNEFNFETSYSASMTINFSYIIFGNVFDNTDKHRQIVIILDSILSLSLLAQGSVEYLYERGVVSEDMHSLLAKHLFV